MTFFNTIKTKLLRLNTKVDDYQEAITFSQAGVREDGGGKEAMTCSEKPGRNLVVASLESRFPDDMVAYALEMAQRMSYDIIAVNAANITHDMTEFFSSTHEDLYRDFKATSKENIGAFREKAETLGLNFAHATNFSGIDQAIDDITKECGQVEFVITENREETRLRDRAENNQRIAQRLFVYSVN